MNRREFHTISFLQLLTLTAWSQAAQAISLNDITGADASTGLKAALEKGAVSAVSLLGVTDGFMRNDNIRIVLPG